MAGPQKSSRETIMVGNKWGCRPVQQGLARKLTQEPHLETCGMQPRGWMAEPSMAIPVVHIAPLGPNAVDAGWVDSWLSGGGLVVVCPRDRRARMFVECGNVAAQQRGQAQ